MQTIFVAADNIVSPLGSTTRENVEQVLLNNSGIRMHDDMAFAAAPFYAAMMAPGQLASYTGQYNLKDYTKFEQLIIASVQDALRQTDITLGSPRTGFIISTTKGNIELLEQLPEGAAPPLHDMQPAATAEKIAVWFRAANTPLVVSTACISALVAILTARRLITSGRYDHVVVSGADVLTKFVLSGFQSFQAVSTTPCKPFDAGRSGVSLGEGAATVVLTNDASKSSGFVVGAGAISNDANHISGPSRTGEELASAMRLALQGSGLSAADIGFVSAHGTATLYNDEMEAKALHHAGLADVPVNSLKGYYGHTLGAAGLIEAIISMHALKAGVIVATKGFETPGVSMPVKASGSNGSTSAAHLLKSVSGFGGCNAAMVFSLKG